MRLSSVFTVLMILITIINAWGNAISIDEALNRTVERSGASQIELIHSSNNWLFFGNPWHVDLEVKLNGEHYNVECDSGFFSDMICFVTEVPKLASDG